MWINAQTPVLSCDPDGRPVRKTLCGTLISHVYFLTFYRKRQAEKCGTAEKQAKTGKKKVKSRKKTDAERLEKTVP